jgi:DNA-binding protein HU-beta
MNKFELIEALANDAGVTKTVAAEVLESFIKNVVKTLKKKGEVRLVGFGTFTTSKRKATTGRNPRTGATIKIAASIQPKFKAGKALKDELN